MLFNRCFLPNVHFKNVLRSLSCYVIVFIIVVVVVNKKQLFFLPKTVSIYIMKHTQTHSSTLVIMYLFCCVLCCVLCSPLCYITLVFYGMSTICVTKKVLVLMFCNEKSVCCTFKEQPCDMYSNHLANITYLPHCC